jgi:hypothetical protein
MPAPPMRRALRVASGLAAAALGWASAASANEPPAIVFKTRPQAVNGTISGRGPLDVTFNMCPTSDSDPGDLLKFTYDFNGDGSIDYYGHCRQTHRYPASAHCSEATVCASDRQPGHRMCQTYTVCSLGGNRGPGPSPSPSPSPDILPFTYDLYAFTGTPGTHIDVSVNTVSAATAFDPWVCLSTTPEGCVLFDENVIDSGDDDQRCTFPPPPPTYECPSFSASLPPDTDGDGIYYLMVSDSAEEDFAGPTGLYKLTVGSDAAIGALVMQADNAPDDEVPPLKTAAAAAPAAGTDITGTPGPGSVRPAPGEPDEQAFPGAGVAAATDRRSAPKPSPQSATTPLAEMGTIARIVQGTDTREGGGPRPAAVFHTLPRASDQGRIAGGALFDVTFDLCGSTSGDPEKELTFSYDFDGDGAVDDSGHCRQTRSYQFDGSGPRCVTSVACVGDGEQGHDTCRTYTVCGAEPTSVRP